MTFNPVQYCPVTGNQPITMTEAGFFAACDGFRAKDVKPGFKTKYSSCRDCGGDIPVNVTIISLSAAIDARDKGEMMAKNTEVLGTCWQCGKLAKTRRKYFGQDCCISCGIVRSHAKNKSEIVIAALREFGNLPDGDGGVDEAGELKTTIEEKSLTIADLRGQLDVMATVLEERRQDLAESEQRFNGELAALPVELGDISSSSRMSDADLQNLVWKFVEAKINDDISVIALDDLKRLAGVPVEGC